MDSVAMILQSRDLPDREFEKISSMIYGICRINLHLGKKELVQARLNKRLRKLGMVSYRDYLNFVEDDETGAELSALVDVLTTNLTYFFREPDHFDFFREEVLEKPPREKAGRFRIWSAGCASGEEAYSLAILLNETVRKNNYGNAKILATDISSKVLSAAREGRFSEQRLTDTPAEIKRKYFKKSRAEDGSAMYQALPEIKKQITFGRLNLMDKWPMTGPFDVVFCRNVMIYFDRKTQAELVARFYDILSPGGYFFVGHSESLTGISHAFKFVRPSIYQKSRD